MPQPELESVFAKAIELSFDCIMICDSEHNMIYVNDAFVNQYGITPEEAVGNHPSVFGCYGIDESYIEIDETIENGDIWAGEIQVQTKDGHPMWCFQQICQVIQDDEIYYVGVQQIITKVIELEEKLVRLSNKLDEVRNPEYQQSLL